VISQFAIDITGILVVFGPKVDTLAY